MEHAQPERNPAQPEPDPEGDRVLDGLTTRDDGSFLGWVLPYLAEQLDVDYVLVGTMLDSTRQDMAYQGWDRTNNAALSFEAPLRQTPGAHVFDRLACFYPQGVTSLFPRDRWLADRHAESYLGLPLRDRHQRPLGTLVAIRRTPLALDEQMHLTGWLDRFRPRIAHALESLRLRRMIDEFPAEILQAKGADRITALLQQIARITRIGVTFCAFRGRSSEQAEVVAVDMRGRTTLTDLSAAERSFLAQVTQGHQIIWSEHDAESVLPDHVVFSSIPAVGFGAIPLRFGSRDGRAVGCIGWIHPRSLAPDVGHHPGVSFVLPFVAAEVESLVESKIEHRQFQQAAEVQQREQLGQLIGNAAHDFGNLLLGVLGYADLLRQKESLDPESRGYAEHIVSAAQEAATICRQLLTYSGQGRSPRVTVDLNQEIRRVVEAYRHEDTQPCPIDVLLSSDRLSVRADGEQLESSIRALLDNAFEALEGDTNGVAVRTERREYSREQLDALRLGASCQPGEFASIEVTDTGRGLDAASIAHAFDPLFTTKHDAPNRPTPVATDRPSNMGRGLGLAAVFGMVEGHGGALEVASKPGRGTTVRILLPAERQPGLDSPSTVSTHSVGTVAGENRSGRILVLDPDPAGRRLLRGILQPSGYEVTTHDSPAEALKIFRERRFDAVVVDFASFADGHAESRSLTEFVQHLGGTPVVALIDVTQSSARVFLEQLDQFRAMTVPVEGRRLLATLSSMLGKLPEEKLQPGNR